MKIYPLILAQSDPIVQSSEIAEQVGNTNQDTAMVTEIIIKMGAAYIGGMILFTAVLTAIN